jgi:hypothetical protein
MIKYEKTEEIEFYKKWVNLNLKLNQVDFKNH